MKLGHDFDRVYGRFTDIEDNEWGVGGLAEIRRYAWTLWYKLSPIQFSRLLGCYFGPDSGQCIGSPTLIRKLRSALIGLPYADSLVPTMSRPGPGLQRRLDAKPELGQQICDRESRRRVAGLVRSDFPYGARIALLGDDDLVASSLCDERYPTVVFDIDERIEKCLAGCRDVEFRHHDIREPVVDSHLFDAVILDPADGSVALDHWLRRTNECLSEEDGARVYLSINPWRVGRRWYTLVKQCLQYGLVPCNVVPNAKVYPDGSTVSITTDLWVFERTTVPPPLPLPYVDIETFR